MKFSTENTGLWYMTLFLGVLAASYVISLSLNDPTHKSRCEHLVKGFIQVDMYGPGSIERELEYQDELEEYGRLGCINLFPKYKPDENNRR